MSPRGKKRTTMAKLDREARRRDRQDQKQARKVARREAAAAPPLPPAESLDGDPAAMTGPEPKETL